MRRYRGGAPRAAGPVRHPCGRAAGALLAALATAAAVSLPAAAEPVAYRVDAARSAAEFTVLHLGVIPAHGRFTRMAGRIVIDAQAQTGNVDFEIAAASIATGWSLRDSFVRGENMFDVAQHPVVRFRSTRLAFAGGRLAHLDGELTLRGVTRPVGVTVVRIDCGPAADGHGDGCDAEADTTIRRRDFGMDFAWPLIGDDVDLTLRIRARRE